MSKSCAVVGCPTKLSKNHALRLFAFPKNLEIRKKWIDACDDPLLNPNSSKICNLHFEDEDYRLQDRLLNISKMKRKLIHTAVPKQISDPDYLNEDRFLTSKSTDYLDFHTDQMIPQNFESKLISQNTELKSVAIEFIDISSYEDFGNNSNQYTKLYKDSEVQCNLFEDLWMQKTLTDDSDCNCYGWFFETLKLSKQIDIKIVNEGQICDSVENEINYDEIQNHCTNTKTRNIEKKKPIRQDNYAKNSNNDGYQCKKCDKKCLNLAAYYAHCDSHLEKSSICSKCGLNLRSRKIAANHERYCINKTKHSIGNEKENITISKRKNNINKTCGICDRTFEKSVTYMDHMNMHNNCKPYMCSCLSKFSHYSNFLKHVRKFKCPVNGRIIPKYAPQGQASKIIEMKEKGLMKQTKRFNCRICGLSYARDKYLKHFYESIHLNAEKIWLKKFNIKTFQCSHCNDHEFDNLSDCISHRSKVHRKFPNDEYLKTYEMLTIKTDDCNNITENIEVNNNIKFINLTRSDQNQPKRNTQLSSKEKYCEKCDKYFVKRITFLDHMNIHIKSYPYICACGVRKRYYQSFLTHIEQFQCKGKRVFPDYAPQTFANSDNPNNEVENIKINLDKIVNKIEILDEEYIIEQNILKLIKDD